MSGPEGFSAFLSGYLVPFMTRSVTGDTPWSHYPWREDALPWPCWAPSQPLSSAHSKCSALSKEGLPPPPCAAPTRITAFNLLKQSKTKKPTQQQQQQQKNTHKNPHTQKNRTQTKYLGKKLPRFVPAKTGGACVSSLTVRGDKMFMNILKALLLLPTFFLTFAVLCSLATSRAPPMLTCRAHRDTKEIFFLATSGTRKHRESLPLLVFPFGFFWSSGAEIRAAR